MHVAVACAVRVHRERERPARVGQLQRQPRDGRLRLPAGRGRGGQLPGAGFVGWGVQPANALPAPAGQRSTTASAPAAAAARPARRSPPAAAGGACAGGSRPASGGPRAAWTRAARGSCIASRRSVSSCGHDAMLLVVVGRAQRLLESRESTRSRALDGAEGALECGRNLGFGKVQEVAQDEHRALARRQRRQRVHEARRASRTRRPELARSPRQRFAQLGAGAATASGRRAARG